MSMEDQDNHEMGFLSANHQLGFSNSDNLDESNEKLGMKPLNKEEEGFEGEAIVSKKPSLENASGRGKEIIVGEEKDKKSCESNRQIRIERHGKKRTRNLFESLHALLPQLPSEVDELTIVSEAVNCIKSLEHTIEKLKKEKQEKLQSIYTFKGESSVINSSEAFIADYGSTNNLQCGIAIPNHLIPTTTPVPQNPVPFQTWSSPNVVLNICGDEAQFCVYTTRRLNLLTTIASVLDKHKIEVMFASSYCNDNGNGYMILAKTDLVSLHQSPEAKIVEEVYKQAAEEIMLLIS